MAHLLMIESWVGASGNLLPPLLTSMGHSYTFITRKPSHYQNPLSNEKHAVFRYAQNTIIAETNEIDVIISAIKGMHFDGVITVCDYYIETVVEVASRLGVSCPFPRNVKEVRRKNLLRIAIENAGLPNAKFILADNWDSLVEGAKTIGYPCVIKPVDLASSAFVKLARNETELRNAFDELASFPLNFREQKRDCIYLLEEYMAGEEVSVETVSFNGKIVVVGITDKSVTGEPYFIENGHMFPAAISNRCCEEITKLVKEVLSAVHYDKGIGHTEVKLTKDGSRIVEINPRTAGNYITELIERTTGINMLKCFIELSLGIEPQLTRIQTGIESAAISFYVPSQGGKIVSLNGEDAIKEDKNVVRYRIEDCVGTEIEKPIDNACYLAHVVAVDRGGFKARRYAEGALSKLQVEFEGKDKEPI